MDPFDFSILPMFTFPDGHRCLDAVHEPGRSGKCAWTMSGTHRDHNACPLHRNDSQAMNDSAGY